MRTRILTAALALALSLPALAQEFKVIVNASNPVDSLGRAQVSQLFLKKSTRWPSGATVQPVEPAGSRLHDSFCDRIHNKSSSAVKSYWNQQIFSGRETPPPQKSEDDVVDFVKSNPGAIGYVSAGAGTGGVKVIVVKE